MICYSMMGAIQQAKVRSSLIKKKRSLEYILIDAFLFAVKNVKAQQKHYLRGDS